MTASEAAQLIQASERFKASKFVELAAHAAMPCNAALAAEEKWRQLKELGILEIHDVTDPFSGKARCEVLLTEEARKEVTVSQDLDRTARPLGAWQVAIADRNLLQVKEIRTIGNGQVEVDFTWEWAPNNIGQKLGMDSPSQTATASLWSYELGWRVAKIRIEDGDVVRSDRPDSP